MPKMSSKANGIICTTYKAYYILFTLDGTSTNPIENTHLQKVIFFRGEYQTALCCLCLGRSPLPMNFTQIFKLSFQSL